jgi:hypothetical protein
MNVTQGGLVEASRNKSLVRFGISFILASIKSTNGACAVACPFFMPIEKLEGGNWLHAQRLPLGCGWSGRCTAPGHEGETPSDEELREFCNLGYAGGCRRIPRERAFDSVRFGVRTLGGGAEKGIVQRVQIRYVCERGHCPVEDGFLEFDVASGRWQTRHRDNRVQRMAECFLAAYMDKRKKRKEPVARLGSL